MNIGIESAVSFPGCTPEEKRRRVAPPNTYQAAPCQEDEVVPSRGRRGSRMKRARRRGPRAAH